MRVRSAIPFVFVLGCVDPSTLRTSGSGVADGSASTNDASAVDAAAGDAGASWELYTFNPFPTVQAWSHAPLAGVWTGANAPPPRDVLATTMLSRFHRLLVVAGDRRLYELGADDVWRTPRDVDTTFPLLAGRPIDGILHVESAPDTDAGPPTESLYWFSGHDAFLYEMLENDAVKYRSQTPLDDEDGGPPRTRATLEWGFTVFDDAKYPGSCDWAQLVMGYEGALWMQNACFSWTRFAPADYPAWSGKPGAPDFSRVRAAYVDTVSGDYELVVEP